MGSLGFPRYRFLGWMNWAPVLGLRQESGLLGLLISIFFNLAPWTWGVGLRAYFLNPISCPPSLGYDERGQGLYRFLNRVRLPRGRSKMVWLGLCHRQMFCDNDDFSTFTLISSNTLCFF